MWTKVAEIMTIMIPAAAHCVHQGWILVIPGSVRPMAATTSATPRNMRNDVDIDSFICATMSAGGKSSRSSVRQERQGQQDLQKPEHFVHGLRMR